MERLVPDRSSLGRSSCPPGPCRSRRPERPAPSRKHASCPVLGVVTEMNKLPRRILAAVDFSEGSLVALRTGGAVAAEGAVLVLAYVSAMSGFLTDEGEATIHELGVRAGFEKLARELG